MKTWNQRSLKERIEVVWLNVKLLCWFVGGFALIVFGAISEAPHAITLGWLYMFIGFAFESWRWCKA